MKRFSFDGFILPTLQKSDRTNYTITVNAPKEVKQIEGSVETDTDPNISEILKEAKSLVGI